MEQSIPTFWFYCGANSRYEYCTRLFSLVTMSTLSSPVRSSRSKSRNASPAVVVAQPAAKKAQKQKHAFFARHNSTYTPGPFAVSKRARICRALSDCAWQNYTATIDEKDLTEPPLPHYRITTEKVVLNVTGKVVVPTIAGLWRGCAVPDQWYLLMNQTGLNFEKPAGKVSERK